MSRATVKNNHGLGSAFDEEICAGNSFVAEAESDLRTDGAGETGLRRGDGAGGSNTRAMEEDAHAESFGTLNRDEVRMAADVIVVLKGGDEGLILVGILFEAGNAQFDGAAKAGADFETLAGVIGMGHGGAPWASF